MIKLINKIYIKDKVTLDIIEALSGRLKAAEGKINDLYRQIFLDYATWYLETKEKEMDIEKRSEDISKRRDVVRTRLLGVGTATKQMIESTVNAIEGVTIETSFSEMTVSVYFKEAAENKLITLAKEVLSEIIPYHLDLFLKWEHVKWQELENVTWGDVKNYTWGEVKDSVEGTVLGGLSPEF